jgi:excisionase family DNA binding protein
MSGLLTLEEMAAYLKVKPSWIYRKTMKKDADPIPHLKFGKYLRFDHQAVMNWILKQQNKEQL